MFYRRKFYVVTEEFVEDFNRLFNEINLPNQLKHGTGFVGRWMMPLGDGRVEVFAIWEYKSRSEYESIEARIRSDEQHVARIQAWYESHGGRESVFRNDILEVRNEEIFSTVPS